LLAERNDFTRRIYDVALSLDGKRVAAANYIWNIPSGSKQTEYNLEKEFSWKELWKSKHAFSPDGRYLVTIGENVYSHVWNVDDGLMVKTVFNDPFAWYISFLTDGTLMTTNSWGTICSIDFNKLLKIKSNSVYYLEEKSDDFESRGFTFEKRNCIFLSDILQDPYKRIFYNSYDDPTRDVKITTDGKMIAIAGYHIVILINRDDQKVISAIDMQSYEFLWSISVSPDKQILATGHNDGKIRLWNINDGSLIRTLDGHLSRVREIAFSSDGNLILSASEDQTVIVWNAEDGSILNTLTDAGDYVIFSPDGKMIVTSSNTGVIRFYGVEPIS
jgi:WD40 repeat protein